MLPGRFAAAFAALVASPAVLAQTSKPLARPAGAGALPAGAQPLSEQLTVVLKLADDPVAVVRSRLPDRKMSREDRESLAHELRGRQQAMIPLIEARGGRVLAGLQHAINGIKVQVPAEKLAALATIPGVVGVKPVLRYHLDNAQSVPFIGADAVWGADPGFRGEGIRIAIIDTGIDYTHANFGGPGTVAAFNDAFAHSTEPANPAFFGPAAPKVKGGTDLVGDDYNANNPNSVPQPDPNPLDCNGHGSHTSGTAAGFGVAPDGTTFHGPFDASTAGRRFIIGPGVAPLADLYMVRVFGCVGSTNVVVDAIDWAVANDMQVISMSLGSDFGPDDSADAEASTNAQNAGVIVVAAAGNAGTGIPFIVSSPGVGDKAISVAAMDSHASFPGANATLSTGVKLLAQDSNGAPFADGTTLPVAVLFSGTPHDAAHISLGCNPAEYVAAGVAGKLVVVKRGVCARVARAIFGQKAGAAAVLMVNTANVLPPFEGPITSNPDDGEPFNVTIPFFGTQSSTGAALVAADGGTVSLVNTVIANPGFRRFATFSSSGPRIPDGHLKPDVSGPGVSVFSTSIGTGNGGVFLSGTSMATPHAAGVAALALQAHPFWDSDDVRKAVVNTADPAQLAGYRVRLGGSGLVQPFPATRTQVIATAGNDESNLSFGVEEFTRDFRATREISVRNLGASNATFAVGVVPVGGAPHTATASASTLTVRAGKTEKLRLALSVPAATVGDSAAFREVAGIVTLSPTTANGNGGAALTIPYLLVPRARSAVNTQISDDFGPRHPSAVARLRNESRVVAGTADFYAWGLRGSNAAAGDAGLRAVGVQSIADPDLGQILVFAVNTFDRWSSASTTVFDILVDVNGDGKPDFDIETADLGLFTTGSFTGQVVSAVFDLNNGGGILEFFATAPTDGSTILIPVVAADAGITPANPRFTYSAQGLDFTTGKSDALAGPAAFNAFNSAISTGAFATLAAGAQTTIPLSIDPAEFALTPPLGVMVVSLENANRAEDSQATLLTVHGRER
ncbi:MAG TPA: S8 family serine peptidase [Myxococcales bacterium]